MDEKMKRLFGEDQSIAGTDPEFAQLFAQFSRDEVTKESNLTQRERNLCILSAILASLGHGAFKNALNAALDDGLDPIAVKELIYQATAYLGIARTYDFLTLANDIMTRRGIALPLAPQGTTNPSDRIEKGHHKQVTLYGEGKARRQRDAPVLRRNINRWLADNCFGDYYTRAGLDDREREMITFCLILSQGGCENQLRGHAAGNLGVGNDKARLYSFAEQCMPYIGYPRTLNALNIIDEIAK